jgi:tripartite-type tricarboxylate transporter receptor subunit TctC
MKKTLRVVIPALLAAAGALLCATAGAQNAAANYPNRVVKIIAPYAPGGSVDALAREFAQAYTNALSKSFVVENRAGAGGNVGLGLLARSPADGYTLGMGAANMLAANRALYTSLPFDTLNDFVPVAFIGRVPFILVAHPSVAADNLKGLVSVMKEGKTAFNYGSSGVGNTAHLFGELFKQRAGVEMVHIPYKSSGEATQELVAGRIQLQFGTPVELLPQINRGAVKAIAIAGAKRLAILPNVPTMAEMGMSGFESPTWFGIIAPKGTPKEIVNLLNEETRKAIAQPALRARLDQTAVEPAAMTPEQFRAFIVEEISKWETIVKLSGAQLH